MLNYKKIIKISQIFFSTTEILQKYSTLQFWDIKQVFFLFYDEICRENREENDKIWN